MSESAQVPFVIGIAGGSGSGKTTVVDSLLNHPVLSESISVLRHDSYYLNKSEMPESLQGTGNWDHPDALETTLFISDLNKLRGWADVEEPVYDFSTHSRSRSFRHIAARPIIIVEGILILAIPEVRERIDLAVFVDTPPEERIVRRILRDVTERERTLESVIFQFRETVRPMHDQFVEPSKTFANIIIPWDWGKENTPALNLVMSQIETKI